MMDELRGNVAMDLVGVGSRVALNRGSGMRQLAAATMAWISHMGA